jgi:hypothetical protein
VQVCLLYGSAWGGKEPEGDDLSSGVRVEGEFPSANRCAGSCRELWGVNVGDVSNLLGRMRLD